MTENFTVELGFTQKDPMVLHCDGMLAQYIVTNPVYQERTKNINKID